MLLRALRVTDKLGNALLRTSIWIGEALLTQLYSVRVGVVDFFIALWLVFRQGRTALATTADRRRQIMARRVAEVAMTTVVREDPLKVQNRALSIFTMVLLLILIGLVVWFTSAGTGARTPTLAPVSGLLQPASAVPSTPTVTPAVTVTPDANPLAQSGSVVYSLRQDGRDNLWAFTIGKGNPLRLTNTAADDRNPVWSPDGKRIAYVSNRDGNWELYIYDLDTLLEKRLTFSVGYKASPTWSPDGQFLAFENYENDNLDIYVTAADGSTNPQRLTQNPAPDFSPSWAPGAGRDVAFVSLREGNADVYVINLNSANDPGATKLTNSPADEDHPRWSNDGTYIAYDTRENGIDLVYVKEVASPQAAPLVVGRGTEPTWGADSRSLLYVVDMGTTTLFTGGQVGATGLAITAAGLPAGARSPSWKAGDLSPALIASGGKPSANLPPLFAENVAAAADAPPTYQLRAVDLASAPLAALSDRVDGSFNALRETVNRRAGFDFLGGVKDLLWDSTRLPEPGQPRQNWHYAGRAFSFDRNLIFNTPPAIELVREEIGVNTFWRVYLRVAPGAQGGQLGEPLKRLPWDFSAATSGSPQDFENGGRFKAVVPTGYYVDLTDLAAQFGWTRLPSDRLWRSNFSGILYWEFIKTEGLTWEQAMLEVVSRADLQSFLSGPTFVPTNRPQSTPTRIAPRTATPLPPP